jgi:phosphotransferase system enzyme I (PtsI)
MALERALQQARAELAALQSASIDPEASALLEFQIAMLEDESLLETAWQAIADGQTATTAWQRAIDVQLAEYVHAEDLYFQARSADLRDMRDRVLRCLAGRSAVGIPPGSVVLTRDLAPSVFLETDWREGGIALFEGSSRSHVAMLARSRNVPMLIGLVSAPERQDGYALLDAERGELVLDPDAADLADFGARRARSLSARRAGVAPTAAAPVHTRSGEHVKLLLNVADGRELEQIDVAHFDGVGLVRTELLLRTAAQLEDEQQQFEAYAAMVRWASGKPVTIRTLDAGADKPIPGYTIEEGNPFLGTRGVRLSLAAPGPLLVQLCAAARAAALGPVRVMVPMVTVPSELEAVRQLLDRAIEALLARSLAHARPALGMMVEVPLAALSIEDFNADFFSIGSNDLVQYLAAASRESGALAALQDPLHPAVLRLIRHVVKSATVRGIDVSLCGDMAADPRCVPALLDTGLRALSMAPAARAAVGGAVAAFSGALLSNPTD